MKALIFLALATVSSAIGADAQSSFESKSYAEAARQQQQDLATAPPAAEGFYNLALTSEKAGDAVQASLNYERALLLDPGLRPARNAFAQFAAANKLPLPPHAWTDDVNAVIHPDLLAVVGSTLFWLGALGFLIALQARRQRGAVIAIASLAMIVGTTAQILGWLSDARLASARPAIVNAKEGVEVLTAPANNSTPIISLPPGSPVGVISPRGSWTYIDLNGGARGWVPTERLIPVVPGETL